MDMSGQGDMMADSLSMNELMNSVTPLSTMAPPMPLDEKQFGEISQMLPSSSSERQVLCYGVQRDGKLLETNNHQVPVPCRLERAHSHD